MSANASSPLGQPGVPQAVVTDAVSSKPDAHPVRSRRWKLLAIGGVILAALVSGVVFAIPTVRNALNTVSTDDAYVNGHVTFVAPRVPGQVLRVLVDDNVRVKAGRPARRTRPGTVPGAGQHQEERLVAAAEADRRAAESEVRGTLRPAPEPAVEAPDGDGAGGQPGRHPEGPGRGPPQQGGDPGAGPKADLARAKRSRSPRAAAARAGAGRGGRGRARSRRPWSSRPPRRYTRFESPSASRPSPRTAI